MYHGDIRLGDTIDIKFCTTSASTGAPTTLSGTPAISAYPGNSTTQLTAGITLSADFDSVTGLNNVRVVATSGNGYATATNYVLVITTGTVGGTSAVGYCVGSFSIEARSALMPTTVARTLDVTATGAAGIDWANVENPTTALNLSGTNIDVDQVVASVSGAVGSVTGAVGSVTGAVGSVTGAVGSVTGNVGGNVVGSVGSVTGLTNATIADAVWDEDATAHQTQGTFGQAIGDPGADTDTIFGLVNTNLDAAVSSRLSSAGYTAPDNTSIAAILVDTAEIGVAGAGLTNINLPNQTMDIVGNITGNLSGSVGSVTGAVGSVTGNVGGNVTGSVGSVVGAVGSVTGNVGGNVVGSVASVTAAVAITSNVKKNQALAKFQFLMTDSTNHAPSTGLTVTVTRSIDGAAFAAGTLSAVTEIGNGMYYVDFGSGDLNGNVITLQATAAASDTTFATIVTQP